MLELIELIFINSLFIIGFNYSTLYLINRDQKPSGTGLTFKEIIPFDREILWFIRYYGNQWLPKSLTKPIYGCLMCMSSFWGTIFYWAYTLNSNQIINSLTLIKWVVVVVVVCGMNRVLKGIAQL